eukprot:7265376-Prymnesium_polylepis.1
MVHPRSRPPTDLMHDTAHRRYDAPACSPCVILSTSSSARRHSGATLGSVNVSVSTCGSPWPSLKLICNSAGVTRSLVVMRRMRLLVKFVLAGRAELRLREEEVLTASSSMPCSETECVLRGDHRRINADKSTCTKQTVQGQMPALNNLASVPVTIGANDGGVFIRGARPRWSFQSQTAACACGSNLGCSMPMSCAARCLSRLTLRVPTRSRRVDGEIACSRATSSIFGSCVVWERSRKLMGDTAKHAAHPWRWMAASAEVHANTHDMLQGKGQMLDVGNRCLHGPCTRGLQHPVSALPKAAQPRRQRKNWSPGADRQYHTQHTLPQIVVRKSS